uniref:Meiosis inhibitor protein 1 n=1 Tax=Oncorhynchus kisutch TaxID=8019 RepID=A0A8C7GIS2_ONCKI
VLVQLLLELQSEQYVCYILDEIDTQLCDQSSVRGFLPTFTFLGKLVDAVPSLPQSLASSHVPLLERLCSTLLYPDEGLKASVFYVWQRVWGAGGAAQSLPSPLRDRVCVLLMQTLSHACSSQLTINCLGFLKQLLKLGEVVSVLMNSPCEQIRSDLDQSLDQDQEAQSSTQLSLERCSLPLILKKLLLCGDETLQVASAQCMAAILVHSPSQYCASFIQADVPEFLFERLNSGSEVLLWSVYSCLLLLTEDPLFFSQCHSVYGIESLVRSLKEALRLTNVEVQRQGLLLLTEILERQPTLPPPSSGTQTDRRTDGRVLAVSTTNMSYMLISLCTVCLCRVNHQSSPVQYKQLEKLVEDIIARCTEKHHWKGFLTVSLQASRAGGFLLQALVCFHAACRLQCSSEPGLKENVFTAPSKQVQDPLESLCLCLLHCCDTVCIPTVTVSPAPSTHTFMHHVSTHSHTVCDGVHNVLYNTIYFLYLSLHHQSLCVCSSTIKLCVCLCVCTRLLPDSTVFSCVVTLLCSVQEQGDSALPPCVLRSALYLLSVTQDKSPDLDWAPLNCISKALSSSPSFASLYTHHPPLLHFLFRYPELAEHFGPRVLELWLSHRAQATPQSDTNSKKTKGPSEQNQDPDNTALLTLLEKSPTVILNLLGMVCTSEAPLAERAVEVLGSFLQGRRGCNAGLCTLLRPTLLQVLQRLGLESSQGTGAVGSLPLVLRLLCLMQTSGSTENEMDGIHFKLLYHGEVTASKGVSHA